MIEYLSGLPAYMAVVLFLAYLIWSKFLNNGKLKPDEEIYKEPVDAIIIIFILFLTFFLTFWYTTILIYTLKNINDISIQTDISTFAFKGEYFGWSVILFALILILEFVPIVGQEKNKDDLKTHLKFLPLFIYVNFCLSLGSLIGAIILAPQYINVFKILTFFIFIPFVVILLILFSEYFVDLFDIKSVINKFPYIFTLIILGIIFIYTLPPKFEIHDSVEYYSINDEIFKYGLAEKEIKRTAYLKRGGYGLKLGNIDMKEFDSIDEINFKYTETNKYGIKENKEHTIYLGGNKENLKFLGITDYIFYNDTKILVFNIDRKLFKQKNITIIISGYRFENISDKFIVNYTPLRQIDDHYEQDITFINHLNYSIQGGGVSLLGSYKERIFRRTCNLTDARGFIEGKNNKIFVDISPDYSYIDIDFLGTRDFYLSIEDPIYNLDILEVSNFKISNNTIVHLTFIYNCSS